MDFNFDGNVNTTKEVKIVNAEQVIDKINIKIEQRNGRKSMTFIDGISNIENLDLKNFTKLIKKKFCCNGSIHDEEGKIYLKFQGDQRNNIKDILIKDFSVEEDSIIMHGF